ncbi:MAG: hypothetical protein O7A69_10775 [SAR324 cluster bacterium]|nr:hypothetical protein [SAR324 cluster bacterium]
MKIFQNFSLIGLALMMGLASSCATSVTGVRKSKDFTYNDIINGGMAIGGVFSIFEELSAKHKNRNATNLQLSIQEEREDYPLTPMPEVRNTLGREKYETLMEEYATDGIFGKPALAELKSALKERFLVVVRIENDDIGDTQYRREFPRKDARGRIISTGGIKATIFREIKVTAHVYDLQKGKSVWNGLVSSRGVESKLYPDRKTNKDVAVLAALVNLAKGKDINPDQRTLLEKYPPPRPPPLFRLLPHAFEAFADELPES